MVYKTEVERVQKLKESRHKTYLKFKTKKLEYNKKYYKLHPEKFMRVCKRCGAFCYSVLMCASCREKLEPFGKYSGRGGLSRRYVRGVPSKYVDSEESRLVFERFVKCAKDGIDLRKRKSGVGG